VAALPVNGRVGSPFGWRWLNSKSDYHTGMDIGAPEGTPVHAVLPGVVVVAAHSGELEGYGNVVVVRHAAALLTLYAHLAMLAVTPGQVVAEGQTLGTVGRTAGTRADPSKMFDASGAHLHLEFLSKWPPAGKDLDRLDPGPQLRALGIVVPQSGPLELAASSRTQPATDYERTSSVISRSSGIAGVLFLAAALYYVVQKQRPRRLYT
jgi:murein DD-endopeptidase MepM/ murein hydrolase activator NlpD